MTAHDLDNLYEQQQAFREDERAAIDEAVAAPVEEARERLEDLAARQQAWLDEQRRLLRDRARQHAQTGRAANQLARVGHNVGKGWSL